MSEATLERAEKMQVVKLPRMAGIAQCTLLRPGAMVSGWWARAMANICKLPNTTHAPFMVEDDLGDNIAEGRNMMVDIVLSKETDNLEMTHLFWIDDDVLPVSPLVLHALYSHDEDICAGVYFFKGEYSQPLIFPERGRPPLRFEPEKCFDCWGVGMGLTLVKASVYRRMRDELKLPLDKNGHPEWYKTNREITVEDNVAYLGGTEDLWFCNQAAKLGIRPCVDTGRHSFGFHLDATGTYGPKNVAYPREQWEQYRKNQPIIWQTKAGPVEWR